MSDPRYEKDLAHLATLKPDWDSYGGVPITPEAIAGARRWIADLQAVPCSDGGVQLEIHRDGVDVEVKFAPGGKVESAYAEDALREAAKLALVPLAALAMDEDRAEREGGLQMLAPSVRVAVVEAVEVLRAALTEEHET